MGESGGRNGRGLPGGRLVRVALYHNLPSGGAKRFLRDLVAALSAEVEFHSFVPASANRDFCPLARYVASETVYPFTLKTASDLLGPAGRPFEVERLWRLWALARRVAREIDRGAFDLVFVDHCLIEQSPSVLRYLDTPTVYYSQEVHRRLFENKRIMRPEYGFRNRLGDILRFPVDRLLRARDVKNARSADYVIANSYHTREALIKTYGVFPDVIYPGIDLDRFRPGPLFEGREDLVLSVGALAPFKGHRFVLEAVGRVPRAIRPSLGVVFNAEFRGEREYLLARASELDVDLKLLKGVSDEGIIELYGRCKVVALGQVVEPFGLVPLEAMACCTPVVAVREGGLRESVADATVGRLVDREPARFAEALAELTCDADVWRRFSEACRPYVKKGWTIDASAARFFTVFERVAKGGI